MRGECAFTFVLDVNIYFWGVVRVPYVAIRGSRVLVEKSL